MRYDAVAGGARRMPLAVIGGVAALVWMGAARRSGEPPSQVPPPDPPPSTIGNDPSPPAASGIPFGPYHLPPDRFASLFTGTLETAKPARLAAVLRAAQAARVRVVLFLAGSRKYYQNPDGSFSLELWKRRVDRFKDVDLTPYIRDGTVVGHYLLDEAHSRGNWNGTRVPFEDIEAAAAYSKARWPELTTFVRSPMTFLEGKRDWRYLDAGWAQFSNRFGTTPEETERYIEEQAEIARRLRLGLVAGLNLLDGGTGVSGRPGTKAGKWAMSGAEVAMWGTILVSHPAVCGFFMWKYDSTYFAREDVRAAMAELAARAASRPRTPCRVRRRVRGRGR
ncbi:MAG TPA: hypothetical protein VNK43_10315 [Gemmatimonadales bacterium]|nr:hypothetical protein [Gemmatimonadales bacterium]